MGEVGATIPRYISQIGIVKEMYHLVLEPRRLGPSSRKILESLREFGAVIAELRLAIGLKNFITHT